MTHLDKLQPIYYIGRKTTKLFYNTKKKENEVAWDELVDPF